MKSKQILILVVIAIFSLSIVAIFAFKTKIFPTNQPNATPQMATQANFDGISNQDKLVDKLALPLFVVQGSGDDPQKLAQYQSNADPEKKPLENIEFSKILDQNNREITAPKIGSGDKLVKNGASYFILRANTNQQIELWNPKSTTLKIIQMPFKFDMGSFKVLDGQIYASESNQSESENLPCGDPSDEIGKCKIYEINPDTFKSTEVISGIHSGLYGGVFETIVARSPDFIWLNILDGDGGISYGSYKKYDAKTKALIYTVTVQNNFSDQTLFYQPAGKAKTKIVSIKCTDDNGPDPSVSLCTPKQYTDFNDQVYKILPKELYQDPNLATNQNIVNTCGKFTISPDKTDEIEHSKLDFGGKTILDLEQVFFYYSECIE